MLWAATVAVVSAVAAIFVGLTEACPDGCRCSLDRRGRREVSCTEGGMKDPIPVLEMPQDTEVLLISSTESRPNGLTLGPIFKRFRHLEEINIVGSGVPALGAHSFWGLRKLRSLNLTQNALSALMDTNFKGAVSLRHLDLSHNQIESIPSAVFRHVVHLRTLDLSDNRVPELVPRIFFGLTRLERLNLSHNPLGDLQPERFSDVPNVHHLSCANCGLLSISSTLLQSLHQLRNLDLRDNRLTAVPPHLSLLPTLEVLRLDGNHISFLERGIMSGAPITHLTLAHNRIIRIESGAFYNCSVTHLDISYNRLSHIEKGTLGDVLSHLHSLILSGNSLHVDQLLSVLPNALKLRSLGIGDMGLTRIPPDLLLHARHLHQLNVSANYLSNLPTRILYSTPHLQLLDLSMNSFRGLQEDLVVALKRAAELLQLRLEGNPWQCDACHMTAMLEWLHSAPDQRSGCGDPLVWSCLTCVGPRQVAGMQISLLPPGDLPDCGMTTVAWPSWEISSTRKVTEEPYSTSSQAGEPPRLPSGPFTIHGNEEDSWSFRRLVEDDLHIVITAACSLVALILLLVIIGFVLYNRHSAYYYTHEDDPEKREKLMKPPEESKNNNGTSKSPLKSKVEPKMDATIATIDELKDINGSQELIDITENGDDVEEDG
ncbi:uncharacterized protein LOC143029194 [Oratosquilla oratoria]|uniref:uncharacterized protein LOC143029194 n=1 Tax=Oratosquilla oratoria TaxID=337810 RepID=UPI003F775F3F